MWPPKWSRKTVSWNTLPLRSAAVGAMDAAALKRRLDELTQEAKKVRGELRQTTKRMGPKGDISEWKWKVACGIIILSNGSIAAGVAYILLGSSETTDEHIKEITNKFDTWWNSGTAESRDDKVLNPTTKQGVAALVRARKIVAEQDLVRWVHDVNIRHGIAPDTSVLNSRRPPEQQCVSQRTRTQWGRRWRARWSIGLGRFAARERLTKEVKTMKAQAMWQWAHWLTLQVPPSKEALRINMDETCVRLHMAGKLGHLSIEAIKQKKWADPLGQSVTLAQQRASCTLVALITDCPAAQPHLPQMILIGKNSLTAQQKAEIESELPEHIILYMGKNGWMNNNVFEALVKHVARQLAPFQNTHQIVFSMDTYPCHLSKESLSCLGQHGMWPHLVPAKMTWALQPLDVHAFAKFKTHLGSTWQRMQLSSASPSKLQWPTMIRAVTETVQQVICGQPWITAFKHTGLTGETADLSDNVLAKVGLVERPTLTARLPTALELSWIFPKSFLQLPVDELFFAWTRSSSSSSGSVPCSSSVPRPHARPYPVAVPLYPWQRPGETDRPT